MPNKINDVPAKRSATEAPTVGALQLLFRRWMPLAANRAAHKASETEQKYDEDHNESTNIGPH